MGGCPLTVDFPPVGFNGIAGEQQGEGESNQVEEVVDDADPCCDHKGLAERD